MVRQVPLPDCGFVYTCPSVFLPFQPRTDAHNPLGQFLSRQPLRLVLVPPHRLQRGRIIGKSRHDVPVDMRQLIAEQSIVDLDGLEHRCQRASYCVDLLDELASFFPVQLEQLCRMPFEHQHRPAGKELILEEIGDCQSAVGDPVTRRGPGSGAGLTVRNARRRAYHSDPAALEKRALRSSSMARLSRRQ